jgi:hypothetical protein
MHDPHGTLGFDKTSDSHLGDTEEAPGQAGRAPRGGRPV